MGSRYLKAEEEAIRDFYPTATRTDMLALIPDRTWEEIGTHARRMRVLRTTQAKGNSIRNGKKEIKGAWSDEENERFNELYPYSARGFLIAAFYPRTWLALQSHAEKWHLHRTREAVSREIKIGKKRNARKR